MSFIFLGSPLEASSIKLQGSRGEIAKQLESDFPFGMSKKDVERILAAKYGVPKIQISESKIDRSPLLITSGGKKFEVHSWLTATISEYRSIRFFFSKITVGAQFNFDKDERLVSLDPIVSRGPEL